MISELRSPGAFYNYRGLAFVLIFLFLFNIIFYFVAVLTAGMFYHLGFSQVNDLLARPDGSSMAINLARYVSLVNLVGYMLLPVFLFTIINGTSIAKEGNLSARLKGANIYLAILITALSVPLGEYFINVLKHIPWPQNIQHMADRFENSRDATVNTILDMQNISELAGCLFIVGVLPAFFEELMFRGVILNIFKTTTKSKWRAIILQALIFALLHLSVYQFPSIFLMGLLFGWIAYETGTIWYGVIMHFLFNGSTVVAEYINQTKFNKTGIDSKIQEMHISTLMAVAAIAGIIVLLRLFKKQNTAEEHA